MGANVSRTDFTWSEENEPHAIRRKEILGKYNIYFLLDVKRFLFVFFSLKLNYFIHFSLNIRCWTNILGLDVSYMFLIFAKVQPHI